MRTKNQHKGSPTNGNFNIRLFELREEVEAVAKMAGVYPADVIRLAVKVGLPIVKEGYIHMQKRIDELTRPEDEK